ncbi:vacuolar sorting protein VPS33/slp1 [Tulasnella sp. 424]|nr:vacuolar sorting protein VPS33/slp1 [Tulasnella sp. 424]KAG8974625.1 vacuolar sorting protein VPS33/slp1 [Tulasnella sp. 425]
MNSVTSQPDSLIELVKHRFLEAVKSVDPPGKWKVVVVDEHAEKFLRAALKQFDVLEQNVTLIESLASHREPQSLEAMYILMPTAKNVRRVIEDFTPFEGGRPMYGGAHLFFIDPLPDQLVQELWGSRAQPYLRQLQDLYLNYRAVESNVFSLDFPEHFFSFYSPPRDSRQVANARARIEEDLTFTAKRILNVLVNIGENPLIRYFVPDHPLPGALADQAATTEQTPASEGSGRWRGALQTASSFTRQGSISNDGNSISKMLALKVQKELDDYIKANPDFVRIQNPNKPKPVLLITDRTMDMFAPFVHEFTYQAMCEDLLPIQNGTQYRYKFQSSAGTYEDQVATLSDADEIWVKLRHLHMQDAIELLKADFAAFMQENAGFTGKTGQASVNDMKDMLANLPQFKEMREKFSLHLNMAPECMDKYTNMHLEDIAKVEQACATGKTPEGKTPKGIVEDMVPLIADRNVPSRDKIRIMALYIMYRQGIPDEDKRRLFEHARLTLSEQDAVNALALMGVRIRRGAADRDLKLMKQKPEDDDYELSRFHPLVKTMLDDHIINKLDPTQFPYVRNAPGPSTPVAAPAPVSSTTSLRSARPGWTAKPSANKTAVSKEPKQRMIVFVIGGMTYSEMREVYVMGQKKNKEIYIGSSHIITPNQFIDDLKQLEHQGVGSKALPNGLEYQERSYQEAYDTKYWTRDPPPRPRPQPAPQQPRPHSGALAPPATSPAPSSLSVKSSHSFDGRGEKEKKKKRHFFGF